MSVERITQDRAEHAQPGEFLCDDRVTGLMLIVGKRVKTWVAQREVKDPETGIRRTARVKLGHFPEVNVQQARDAAKDQLRQMEKGYNPHTARRADLTVKTAVQKYIDGAVDLRPRSIEGYQYCLDQYIAPTAEAKQKREAKGHAIDWPIVGNLPLSQLGAKPTIVKNLHLALTKSVGKSTANGVMRTLSAAYNGTLATEMDLPRNPVTRPGVVRWHRLKRRDRRIAEDGFAAWGQSLQTVTNPIRRAMRLFLLLTGQRDEATRVMQWDHVDFPRSRIHYPLPKGGERAAFDLPMSPPVQRVLEFVRSFSVEDWAFPGSRWVWPAQSKTGHIAESKEQRRAELLNPHALRRTFISVGYEVAPNKYVSYIANHRVHDSMTDEYFQPSLESVGRALVTIDNAILDKIGIDLNELLGETMLTSGKFKTGADILK
jgi:integrase